MKKISILFLLFTCVWLEGCKKNQNQQIKEDTLSQTEKSASKTCYKALYQKDTIDLKINTLLDGKITGNMVMNVFNEPKRVGEIEGEFRGDTLFCSFTFILSTDKKITYKNPMAFLKEKNELVLGNGKIENYLGASYFVKGTPIDFDNVKYRFTIVDCIDKN